MLAKQWFGRFGRSLFALLAAVLLLSTGAGCRNEEDITRTTEPRAATGKAVQTKSDKVETRILGVIAPGVEGGSWFFKLMGPAEGVGNEVGAFDQFLSSLEFTKSFDKPSWTLPEGWRAGRKSQMRYATIVMGPADAPLELTVMPAGGSLLENVNRWRDQLTLERIKADELQSVTKEVTTKQGIKVTRVDLTGMAGKGPAMPPFMKGN